MDSEKNETAPSENGEIQELTSRPLTDEERYFFEHSYKEPVESITRIEEAAKFLVGATATTSGLFLAAFKLSLGDKTVSDPAWFVPFICWAISILAFILVLFPETYRTGSGEPASWKKAFLQARKRKFRWLFVGTAFFVAGILSAVYPFAR